MLQPLGKMCTAFLPFLYESFSLNRLRCFRSSFIYLCWIMIEMDHKPTDQKRVRRTTGLGTKLFHNPLFRKLNVETDRRTDT
jgi:hypothetical protein